MSNTYENRFSELYTIVVSDVDGELNIQTQAQRYAFEIDPECYNHFLRLNNRKKTQSNQSLVNAGYPFIRILDIKIGAKYKNKTEVIAWCDQQFKKRYIYHNGYFYFVSNKEKSFFLLKWT